jgi:hypothetical protein
MLATGRKAARRQRCCCQFHSVVLLTAVTVDPCYRRCLPDPQAGVVLAKSHKSLCSKDQGVCPRESGFIASNLDAVGSCYLASPLWYAYKRMRSAVQEMTTQSPLDRTMHETRRKGPWVKQARDGCAHNRRGGMKEMELILES